MTESEIGLGEVLLNSKQYKQFIKSQKKLAQDYPLDYLLGDIRFLDKKFYLDETVLIPREETEYWVKNLQETIEKGDLLVDIGAGSGVIGISLNGLFKQVCLVDVSKGAINICDKNIMENDAKNTQAIQSDLFENKELKNLINNTDNWTLVANLPYLPESEKKYKYDNNVSWEPDIALYSGIDGLDLFKKMIYQLSQLKLPDYIYLELDPGNVDQAADILTNAGYETSIRIDIYGKNRFLVGQR